MIRTLPASCRLWGPNVKATVLLWISWDLSTGGCLATILCGISHWRTFKWIVALIPGTTGVHFAMPRGDDGHLLVADLAADRPCAPAHLGGWPTAGTRARPQPGHELDLGRRRPCAGDGDLAPPQLFARCRLPRRSRRAARRLQLRGSGHRASGGGSRLKSAGRRAVDNRHVRGARRRQCASAPARWLCRRMPQQLPAASPPSQHAPARGSGCRGFRWIPPQPGQPGLREPHRSEVKR